MNSIETLKESALEIQKYLEIECSNSPEAIKDRMNVLMTYIATSGELLAQAKRILRAKKSQEISKTILAIAKESFLSATVQNALLDSICEEENYMVDFLDRINRSATHQLDALRSLLSYEKEALRLNNTGY